MVNDYDTYAAKRHESLLKGSKNAHKFVEKPAMKALLPDLSDKKILLLGCGTGEEVTLLEQFGATSMTGIDLSEGSIKVAAESYPQCDFRVMDMHNLDFEDNSFDFIYSSLVVHYSAKPQSVYKEIMRVLKPGGTFQFSVGHPMRWASERIEINGATTKLMGYT
jgi:ubiquinone/menaquinone biosynthesis C-methylase UbiE